MSKLTGFFLITAQVPLSTRTCRFRPVWPCMAGIFAIKLSTFRLDGVGSGTGSRCTVSPVDGLVGTLVLGWFLFPLTGSREFRVVPGISLLIPAVVVASYGQKWLGVTVAISPQ